MEYYSYKAVYADGKVKSGVIGAEDKESVQSDLTLQGLSVLSVERIGSTRARILGGLMRWGVGRSEIVELATNLAVILKAGIPLQTALEEIAAMVEGRYFRRVLQDVRDRIAMGSSFAGALAYHRTVFPDIFIRLAAIGEETGRLDTNMQEIASHLQRMDDLAAMVKRALMYPIFAFITTMGALIFWLAYVLPKIITVLKDLGVKLPAITRAIVAVSDFVSLYWVILLVLAVILFITFQILRQTSTVRYYVDLSKLHVPIIRGFVRNRILALFCEQMRIIVVAGITVDRSLMIVAPAMGSAVFTKALERVRVRIMEGGKISSALREQKVFPSLLTRMVDIGETSGNLDNQFSFLSEYYFKKLEDITEKLGKTLEPLIMIVIGGIFAVMMIGLIMPVYDLVSKLGRGL
jgi:type II secretory pathway component PulF